MKFLKILIYTLVFVQSISALSIYDQNNGWPALIHKYKKEQLADRYSFSQYAILQEIETNLKKTVSLDELIYIYDNLCDTLDLSEIDNITISCDISFLIKRKLIEKIRLKKEEQVRFISEKIKSQNKPNIGKKIVTLTSIIGLGLIIYKYQDFLKEKSQLIINQNLNISEKAKTICFKYYRIH